jgi:hypothetical protein
VTPLDAAEDPLDAVVIHDPNVCESAHLTRLRANGATVVMRAYREPERLDACRALAPSCDLTLTTGFADCVELYSRVGARALTWLPASPPSLTAGGTHHGDRPIDLLFAGRLDGPERRHRRDLLARAADRWRVHVTSGQESGAQLDAIHRQSKLALHWDRVAVNRDGITRGSPGTRPFAGPAAGCVLLTYLASWMPHCYDVTEEVAGFSDADHALEVAAEYLQDDERRARTAGLSRARCLEMHTCGHRASDLEAVLRGETPLHLQVLSLGPWYQRIELGHGVVTSLLTMSNLLRWQRLAPHLPDVGGQWVVDFGANAGFFSLKCLERGAARVTAIDRSALACRQAQFVVDRLNVQGASVLQGGIELLPAQPADVVLLLAVLHHHADIEPLLRAATARSPRLVLEWHVREQPHYHPVERVVAVLANLGYEATVAEGGARPIVLARPSRQNLR